MLTEQQQAQLDWEKTDGLLPVVVQHAVSGEVLMLGYMNQEALAKTIDSGKVTFFSRTKQRLWTKGETSGHFLNVVGITPDCDNDTLLVLVNPIGPTCHKGTSSCFGEASHQWLFLYQLEQLLAERKSADPESSYTAKLYASGTKRIAQKVGEEGVETALAATVHDREELTNEASDLMYHLLVLLQDQELDLTTVIENLRKRHKYKKTGETRSFFVCKSGSWFVVSQRVTAEDDSRTNDPAEENGKDESDGLFRAVTINRQIRFHDVTIHV